MRIKILILLILSAILIIGCEEAAKALSTTISGYVRDDSEPIEGAIVFVLDFGDSPSDGMDLESGSITLGEGRYTVIEVEPGEYYVCAIEDVNGNLSYDQGTDQIGYYGTVVESLGISISIPEKVTIQDDGEDVDSINIEEMYILP